MKINHSSKFINLSLDLMKLSGRNGGRGPQFILGKEAKIIEVAIK